MFPAGFCREGELVSGSVEAVCFSPHQPVGLTGSLSGVLGVWDLPTQKLRLQCVHQVIKIARVKVGRGHATPYICPVQTVKRWWLLKINTQMSCKPFNFTLLHLLESSVNIVHKIIIICSQEKMRF